MQILHHDHIQFTDNDVIFRESAVVKVAFVLLFLAASTVPFVASYLGKIPWLLALLPGSFVLFFAFYGASMLRKVFGPENWLLACNGQRIVIKFRSYLNTHFPATDPQLLVLDLSEVAAVREARSNVTFRLLRTGPEQRRYRFLDIIVRNVDLTELRKRLQYERELKTGGSAWRHYPVTVVDDSTIRIEWSGADTRITPGLADAIRIIGAMTARQEAQREDVDFTNYRKMRPDELEREIRKLVERGEVLPATKIIQYAYGMNTTEAHQYVQKLLGGF